MEPSSDSGTSREMCLHTWGLNLANKEVKGLAQDYKGIEPREYKGIERCLSTAWTQCHSGDTISKWTHCRISTPLSSPIRTPPPPLPAALLETLTLKRQRQESRVIARLHLGLFALNLNQLLIWLWYWTNHFQIHLKDRSQLKSPFLNKPNRLW